LNVIARQPKTYRAKSERRRLMPKEIAALADRAEKKGCPTNPRRAYDKEDADERPRIAARPAERGGEDPTRNPDNATLPG
jgi:hypothetical protein